jgi:hypothetical protein
MVLYALFLHPLLRTLEDRLHSIHIWGTKLISPILSYADDVTVLVTHPKDFDTILQSIHTYEKATEARLNTHKSKALAIAKLTSPATARGIDSQEQITILGVKFASTLRSSMKANWDCVVRAIRVQARITYARQLSLAKRLHYVQQYVLSKIWYMAQTFLPHTKHVQQLTSVCTWYIWRGAPFRVSVTTLRRPKDQGGWAMTAIGAKCRILICIRIWTLSNKVGSLTESLIPHWNLTGSPPNPQFLTVSPPKSPTSKV